MKCQNGCQLGKLRVDDPKLDRSKFRSQWAEQGWNFGRFLVLLGFIRLYALSGKYSPSIPFPIEPEIPGTQSTRLRPQFHTESPIGKPKILKRQTHGITTKAYRSV